MKFVNDATIDLSFDEAKEISSISFNSLRYTISGVYPPHTVEVHGSKDGRNYFNLGSTEQIEIASEQGRNKINTKIEFDELPVGHHKAGQAASMRIDEIVVE